MGWKVTPSDNVSISEVGNGKANITFPANTSDYDIQYTVQYTDNNGNCGVYKITQDKKTNGPCNLKQNNNSISKDGGSALIFTYSADICRDGSFFEVTTVTSGIEISYDKSRAGRILGTFPPNTGAQREIKIQVKQTKGEETETNIYTFTQLGTGGGDLGSRDFNYIYFMVHNSTQYTIEVNAHFFLHFTDGTSICCYKFGHTDAYPSGNYCNKYPEITPGDDLAYVLDNNQFFTSTSSDLSNETKIPEGYDHLRTVSTSFCIDPSTGKVNPLNTLDGEQSVVKDSDMSCVNTTFLNNNRNDMLQNYLGKSFDTSKPPRAFAYDTAHNEVEFKCRGTINSYYCKSSGTKVEGSDMTDGIFRNGYGDDSNKHAVAYVIDITGFADGQAHSLCH